MDFVVAIKTDSEAAEVMQPAECSFRYPSKNAKAASVFLIPSGQVRFDPSLAKFFAVRHLQNLAKTTQNHCIF